MSLNRDELIRGLEIAREVAIRCADDTDDTLFAQLTFSEINLITYSLILVGLTDAELYDVAGKLTGKLADLIQEQKDV